MSYDYLDIVGSGKLSELQNETIYQQEHMFFNSSKYARPRDMPTAICIGGQPGSGKSSILKNIPELH
jgi:2-phosphoglycerate kinase